MRQLPGALVATGVVFLTGCAQTVASDDGEPPGDDGSGGGTPVAATAASAVAQSSSTQGSGGAAGPCDDLVFLAPADELAATPRADATAEGLGLETSGAFVVDEALYVRVASELEAIRELEPAVSLIEARPNLVASIVIGWSAPVVDPSTYQAWDCLNSAYGLSIRGFDDDYGEYVSLGADEGQIYDSVALAAEYAQLPNVLSAHSSVIEIDGPDVCLEIRGDADYFVFDEGGGDCPAGCTTHVWYGFRVAPGEAPEPLGVAHDDNEEDGPPASLPPWLEDLADCRANL